MIHSIRMNADLEFLHRRTLGFVDALMARFCSDPKDRNYGGFVDPVKHYADSRESIYYAQLLFCVYLYPEFKAHHRNPALLDIIRAHLVFMQRRQRDDGSVMLQAFGAGTGSEVGFTLPGVAETYRRVQSSTVPGRDEILAVFEQYIQRGAACVRLLPAHTSNHRWAAFAGPLAVVNSLFPDPANAEVIEEYLSDGIDLDQDGLYYEERSPVYNEVANYGLLYLADYWGRQDLLGLVARNLRLTILMRQPNGEAETLFSHRQDRGRAEWRWGDYFLFRRLAVELKDPVFAQAADELRRQHDGVGELAAYTPLGLAVPIWYYYDDPRLRAPDHAPRAPLREHFEVRFATTPLWRWRHGAATATVAADKGGHFWDITQGTWGGLQRSDAFMSLHAGLAAVDAMKLRWGTGTGGFRPDKIEYLPDGTLRLGYVDPGWDHVAHFRPHAKWGPRRTLVDQHAEVTIRPIGGAQFSLRIRIGGWADMPVHVQFLLRETGVLLVPGGTGEPLRFGGQTFSPAGGAYVLRGPDGSLIAFDHLPASEHRMPLGDQRTITGLAEQRCHRLILGLFTPVDISFTLALRPAALVPA